MKPLRLFRFGAVSVALSLAMPVDGAADQAPRPATDVSGTAYGRSIISDAAGRFAAASLTVRNLRAWRDAGGYLVAEASTNFEHVSVVGAKGLFEDLLVPTSPISPTSDLADDSQQRASLASIESASTWSTVGSDCFNRYSDGWSWLDHCYTMYKLTSDGNSSYDWYALRRRGTAGPISPWVINWAGIDEHASSSGSPQTWADWDPNYDYDGPCRYATVSVSYIVGLSMLVQQCELVAFGKDNPAVNYAQVWSGPGTRLNRGLGFEIIARVAQNGWPVWSLGGESHGGAF